MALVLVVAISGFVRGTVRQVFSLLGIVAGVWVAGGIAQWVGHHWQGARPTVVFWALRWLVAVLGGLALVSLLQWLGDRIAGVVKDSPVGVLDRLGGLVLGTAVGVLSAAIVMVALALVPLPPPLSEAARASRLRDPVLREAERACLLGEHMIPGSTWLARRIDAALRQKHPVSTL